MMLCSSLQPCIIVKVVKLHIGESIGLVLSPQEMIAVTPLLEMQVSDFSFKIDKEMSCSGLGWH